ncbi:MAG: ADP-ribosylation/crystallin J1 [Bacteroidota bacterium]
MRNTKVLYRPVGINELTKIIDLDLQGFPPRLSWQPIFYPVLNFEYAEQIARDWNAKSDEGVGFVTRFAVNAEYLSQFEVQTVGGPSHQELWVPAEELDNFNRMIAGKIEVVSVYYSEKFDRDLMTPDIKELLKHNNHGNK